MTAAPADEPSIRRFLVLSIPAIVLGAGSALMLAALDLASEWLSEVLWEHVPNAVGFEPFSAWWIVAVLTLTGAAVGLIVWLVPGHAGFDSATTEFDSPPPAISAVPSLLAVTILGLAGGVSLGPENPIIAVNAALAIALFARGSGVLPAKLSVVLATAGTIGALFGTPVAAALVLTAALAAVRNGGSLWDKLFLPLAAAAAGAVTMGLIGGSSMTFDIAPYEGLRAIDLLTGSAVAAVAALVGIAAAWVFPYLHRGFHALRNPVLFTTLGGLLLGLLGALGGPLTMFKGLRETGELIETAGEYTVGALLALAGVKIVALLVAASSGFRGGRIFPAIFVGVALGLAGHAIIPGMPLGLALASGVLGIVLVATRDGWIALFLAVTITGDVGLLTVLCIVVLPTWLLVTKAPHLQIHDPALALAELEYPAAPQRPAAG